MVQNLSKQRHLWYVPSLLSDIVLLAALHFFSFLLTHKACYGGCTRIAYPSAAMAVQQQGEHGFPYYKERQKIKVALDARHLTNAKGSYLCYLHGARANRTRVALLYRT